MTVLFDLLKFKKSKNYVKELSHLQKIMYNSMIELHKYKHYIPVQECLETLKTNHSLIKIHLEHQKKIEANKGNSGKTE